MLAHFFDKFEPSDVEWLDQHAITLIGMVDADATEAHFASYLRVQGKNIRIDCVRANASWSPLKILLFAAGIVCAA